MLMYENKRFSAKIVFTKCMTNTVIVDFKNERSMFLLSYNYIM